MGILVEHISCPLDECGSSDALAVYQSDDGSFNGYCFSCHNYVADPYNNNNNKGNNKNNKMSHEPTIDISKYPIRALEDRGISQAAAEHFGVRVEVSTTNGEPIAHYYPTTKNGVITGWKRRDLLVDKKYAFKSIGDRKDSEMFGQNVCGSGGKLLVITEGECDAMAAWDLFRQKGKLYKVCSLPDGASVKAIKNNLEWINSFESVVLCFDQDEPGQKAAKQAAEIIAPGKARIMTISEKDPNDMLRKGKFNEFYAALANATQARPDGIVSGKDTWEIIKNRPKVVSVPYPDDWKEMNEKTYGVRLGELDTWTSGSGMGKTQIMREIEFHLLNKTEDNIGCIKLEEPLVDSIEAIMGLYLNKRIHLPDVRETVSDEQLYEAWLNTAGTNRLHYYDHFGSVDEDSLLSKIRYLAKGLDCKYIILDHLSIVVSEFADQGGERERIDAVMTKLKKLTQELNIWIGLVVHLRKSSSGGKSFEEGGVPSLDDLRGSGAIKQLSNSVYAIARNQQAEDDYVRNTSSLHVLKCRFSGRTGKAGYLHFDDETGRMIACGDPEIPSEEGEKF